MVNLLQREAEVNSSIQLFHDDQSQGVFPAGLINGNDGEYPSDYDNYYNDDYDDELPSKLSKSVMLCRLFRPLRLIRISPLTANSFIYSDNSTSRSALLKTSLSARGSRV